MVHQKQPVKSIDNRARTPRGIYNIMFGEMDEAIKNIEILSKIYRPETKDFVLSVVEVGSIRDATLIALPMKEVIEQMCRSFDYLHIEYNTEYDVVRYNIDEERKEASYELFNQEMVRVDDIKRGLKLHLKHQLTENL